jgi:2-(1,2-epoxy-1,2-dihydrophenyl)acetyl-CoA isomerase
MTVEPEARDGADVLVRRAGAVATVLLNRPSRLNALTHGSRLELLARLRELAVDDAVRAVVLTGEGRAFCAGQDLTELDADADVGEEIRGTYNPIVRLLTTMPKPAIAAINGPCAGAGLGLALACDGRLMAADAFLSCAFAGIGLVPDSGVSAFLVELVGYARAFDLAASGRRVPADEALALGLVGGVVPGAELPDAAAALAAGLAAGPTRALGLTKELLRGASSRPLEAQLGAEAAAQVAACATDDHREGLAAFAARRPPAFRGC